MNINCYAYNEETEDILTIPRPVRVDIVWKFTVEILHLTKLDIWRCGTGTTVRKRGELKAMAV